MKPKVSLELERLFEESLELANSDQWKPFIEAVKEAKGGKVDEAVLAATARCLENTRVWMGRMDEATRSVNVGNFIKHGFDLITAVLPSLISTDIASLQPLKRRVGEIFFLEILYGKTRGNVKSGDQMFGTRKVGNINQQYTSEDIPLEPVGVGNGTTGPFTGSLLETPVVPGSVYFSDEVPQEYFHDDGRGVLIGSGGGTGTINYASGAFSVTYAVLLAASKVISCDYSTDFEANPQNVGEVIFDVRSISVEAKRRRLRVLYSLDAAYDLEMAFQRNADVELTAAAAGEIRTEIDTYNMNQIYRQAGLTKAGWDPDVPTDSNWRDHKFTLIDHFIQCSNLIFDATRRGRMMGAIVGLDVMNVIQSLEGRWRPSNEFQPGPHFAGTLDNWRIYANPNYGKRDIVAYYKGDLWIESGFVYAPYLPLYTTPNVQLDDFVNRKGLASAAATKMVNPNFFVKTEVLAPTP